MIAAEGTATSSSIEQEMLGCLSTKSKLLATSSLPLLIFYCSTLLLAAIYSECFSSMIGEGLLFAMIAFSTGTIYTIFTISYLGCDSTLMSAFEFLIGDIGETLFASCSLGEFCTISEISCILLLVSLGTLSLLLMLTGLSLCIFLTSAVWLLFLSLASCCSRSLLFISSSLLDMRIYNDTDDI